MGSFSGCRGVQNGPGTWHMVLEPGKITLVAGKMILALGKIVPEPGKLAVGIPDVEKLSLDVEKSNCPGTSTNLPRHLQIREKLNPDVAKP